MKSKKKKLPMRMKEESPTDADESEREGATAEDGQRGRWTEAAQASALCAPLATALFTRSPSHTSLALATLKLRYFNHSMTVVTRMTARHGFQITARVNLSSQSVNINIF